MTSPNTVNFESPDTDHAVSLGNRIWWVGHHLPGDSFQCHVYLIENGDQSVLIDPGSKLTFHHALRKVEEVIPFNKIRYFVCQHQDPDITGALPLIDQITAREDVVIISHWRAIALLKHYGLRLPFWCVEENGWKLNLGRRELQFIFTPYLHFPGAFCTFDARSGILFSSDLFGGFTEEFSLFARGEEYLEGLRFFHEHYMPSREILYNALTKMEKYPINIIAPQHGSIILPELVNFYFQQLKNIDCGLYLMTQTSTDVMHLSRLNKMLRRFMETMVLHRAFSDVARSLLTGIQDILPIEDFEFYALTDERKVLHFAAPTMYRGLITDMPKALEGIIGLDRKQWKKKHGTVLYRKTDKPTLALPLPAPDQQKINALAIMHLTREVELDEETEQTLLQISLPLSVAMEREMIQRTMEIEKQKFYELAIRDPLTGLYTRVYMQEAVRRLFAVHDREPTAKVAIIMFDIDHFKSVNDSYGHGAGDEVLKKIAEIIASTTRGGDIPVRMGGEEFGVFVSGSDVSAAEAIAERVRQRVCDLKMPAPMEKHFFSISGGIAYRKKGEKFQDLVRRADKALYDAKTSGRNRVCLARPADV